MGFLWPINRTCESIVVYVVAPDGLLSDLLAAISALLLSGLLSSSFYLPLPLPLFLFS